MYPCKCNIIPSSPALSMSVLLLASVTATYVLSNNKGLTLSFRQTHLLSKNNISRSNMILFLKLLLSLLLLLLLLLLFAIGVAFVILKYFLYNVVVVVIIVNVAFFILVVIKHVVVIVFVAV